jgi:sarcosine oxidase subunit beta
MAPENHISPGLHVAVVGAGIIGCCAAFHLLEAGVRRVTLLDAGEPGSATTGAGAGFVSHWSAGFLPQLGLAGLAMQQYALDFYRTLSALGTEIGYRPTGTLQLSLTEEGFERFARPVLDSPWAPSGMRRLAAGEVGDLMQGLVDPARIFGGVLNPHGIQVETGLALALLVREIERRGGRVRAGTRVLGLRDHGSGVSIETSAETLEADRVVLSAGAWINELLGPLGWRMPLMRMAATRIVTDDRGLASNLPTIQCRELRLWLRESFGAITWGTVAGYAPLHGLDAATQALQPGRPHVIALLDRLMEQQGTALEAVFPPLRGSKVASWSQGIPCYTPDHNLLVGIVPGHPAIIAAGGDNETGVSHGPGLGRLIAELALGAPTFVDARSFRLERFAAADYPTEASVEAALLKESPVLASMQAFATLRRSP